MAEPLNLQGVAESVARENGDHGGVVITAGDNGEISIGVDGLDPHELREMLCAAIHLSYAFDEGVDFTEESEEENPT